MTKQGYRMLTEDEIQQIKNLRAEGHTQTEIAKTMGIVQSTVCYLLRGEHRKRRRIGGPDTATEKPTPKQTLMKPEKSMTLERLIYVAMSCAELVAQKNEAYGNSFETSGQILALMYPNGVQPSQYTDMLATVRVLDKLQRIATDKDALGENPWRDIMGYALLSVVKGDK